MSILKQNAQRLKGSSLLTVTSLIAVMGCQLMGDLNSATAQNVPPATLEIAQTEIMVSDLQGFDGVVKAIALTPDGKTLIVGSADGRVSAIDLEEGKIKYSQVASVNFYSSIAMSKDGKMFAMGDEDNIVIFETETGNRMKTLRGHTNRVSDVAMSPDDNILVSVSGGDRTVRIWDVASGNLLKTLSEDVGPTTNVVFTPDGKLIVTGAVGDDRTLKVWDAETAELRLTSPQQAGYINGLAVTEDGKLIAAIRNTIKAWNLSNVEELYTTKGPSLEINTIAVSPDGKMVATANKEGTIMLFDANSGQLMGTLPGHKGWVLSLAFSPDSKVLYSGAEDKTVKIWQLVPEE